MVCGCLRDEELYREQLPSAYARGGRKEVRSHRRTVAGDGWMDIGHVAERPSSGKCGIFRGYVHPWHVWAKTSSLSLSLSNRVICRVRSNGLISTGRLQRDGDASLGKKRKRKEDRGDQEKDHFKWASPLSASYAHSNRIRSTIMTVS